jgi:hypothetical protein
MGDNMTNKGRRYVQVVSFLLTVGSILFVGSQPVQVTTPEIGLSCYTVRSPFTDKDEAAGCFKKAGILDEYKTAQYQPQFR